MEDRCWIRGYLITDYDRPRAVLKRSPEDFVVDEIGPDGRVVVSGSDYQDAALEEAVCSKGPPKIPEAAELVALGLDPSEAEAVLQLHASPSPATIILKAVLDKQQRTQLHVFFKEHFGGKLVTECHAPGSLLVRHRNHQQQASQTGPHPYRPDARNRTDSRTAPPFLEFVLQKRNMSVLEAVMTMSKVMSGKLARDFSFAGTKDRCAITTQRMRLRGGNPKRLLGLNGIRQRDGQWFRVSGLKRAEEALSLGDLAGNAFHIRAYFLPPVGCDTLVHVRQAIERLKTSGFINYFGLQRFGTHQTKTDQVGEAILRGDYQAACNLIITDRFPKVRDPFLKGDYGEACKAAPYFLHTERAILLHLSAAPHDFQGALMALPRETRMLYVHAWQSRIFNELATKRMERGNRPAAGDLVLDGASEDGSSVIVVDASNVSTFTIYDVVLPLPGYATLQHCEQMLPGVSKDILWSPKNKALYDLPGTFRKLVAVPRDLQCVDLTSDRAELKFSLSSSSYATMALRELFDCGADCTEGDSSDERDA